jgi:hypothetical protein
MNFMQIACGINVIPLLLELQRQPELWDKNPCRLSKRGPHYETHDVILRCNDERPFLESSDYKGFNDEHISKWYASWDRLPSARKIVFDLMAAVQGEQLGAVLIYKVPPGAKIHPHIDPGWHVGFYDKYNVCLQSNNKAAFLYENEAMQQCVGDVHHFRNDVTHSVVNNGDSDHIVMTVCIRHDRGDRVPWSPEGWAMDGSK